MEKILCDGCASMSEETEATHSIETWDEGNGFIIYHYCNDCFDGLDNICDRCGTAGQNVEGFALCQDCLNNYNAGEHY